MGLKLTLSNSIGLVFAAGEVNFRLLSGRMENYGEAGTVRQLKGYLERDLSVLGGHPGADSGHVFPLKICQVLNNNFFCI